MPPSDQVLFHLTIPRRLIQRLDRYWRDNDYTSRSEAMREILRRALDAEDAATPPRAQPAGEEK